MITGIAKEQIAYYFYKNFMEEKDDRQIVIYGTGEWTQAILEKYPDAPVYGLLDGYYSEGEFRGKKIISLESLKGKNVKIVIVARKASEILVYKRIANTCKECHIPVYNLEGVCLDASKDTDPGLTECDIDSLYRELLQFEYVSFDIFDTLLLRKTVFREKLYQMLGQIQNLDFDFCGVRLQAEKSLHDNNREPSLEDIYKCIRDITGISQDQAEDLKTREIQLEMENLVPRKKIVDLYNKLTAQGKKVWLISDMYFSKAIIESILSRNGIDNYENLLVSCECGVRKQNGLFQIYLHQITDGQKAHIGDSKEVDGYYAKANGIVPFIIPSVIEIATQKKAKKLLMNFEDEHLEYIRGLAFSQLFDTKKLISPAIWLHTGYQLGFCLVAPVLYGWARWIYECCMDKDIEKLLFVSRDGYLLRKVFRKICQMEHKNIETEYLVFSRSLGWRASVCSEKDLRALLQQPFAGNISEWLNKRFDISVDDMRNFTGNEEVILSYLNLIRGKSEQTRRQYQKYWTNNISGEGKTAFVDFVSVGTCQKCLEKLTGKQFYGMYFEYMPSSDGMVCADSYIHALWERDIPPYNYLLWELFIKEPGPSVKDIDSKGDFIYGENRFDHKGMELVREIHRGVLDFTDQYLSVVHVMQEKENINKFVKAVLELLDDRYVNMDEVMARCLYGFDEFTNRKMSF